MIRLRVFPKADVKGWPDAAGDSPVGAQSWPSAEITSALAAEYATDAHTVGYEADDGDHGCQRLNADAPAKGVHPRMVVHFVDVDCAKAHREHGEAPADWRAAEAVKVEQLQADVPGIVCYLTRGGYRLVGVLRTPVVIDSAEAAAKWKQLVARRLAWLSRRYGIHADPAPMPWQNLYRLPHATRPNGGGRPEARPVVGDWSAIGTWPDAIDEELPLDVAEVARLVREQGWPATAAARLCPATVKRPMAKLSKRSRDVKAPAIAADVGAITRATRAVADALAQLPRGVGARHNAILAVVGALLDAGWTDAPLRRVLDGIGALLGDASAEIAGALAATHRRRASAQPYTARGYLRDNAPGVHDALQATLDEAPAETWRRVLDRTPAPAELTADAAITRVRAALSRMRKERGLVVIDVTASAGKSYGAADEARQRAAEGKRTAILAPSHTVARELTALLSGWGVAVTHLTGVLSHRNDAGELTCQHHVEGKRLAAAGGDVVDVLCDGRWYGDRETKTASRRQLPLHPDAATPSTPATPAHLPCAHRDACPARAAAAAQAGAMQTAAVVVAVHQLAEAVHQWLLEQPDGALAVIDEGPQLFTASRLTAGELAAAATAVNARRSAVVHSETWRGPMLAALSAGVAAAPTATNISDVLVAGLAVTELHTDEAARRELIAGWAQRCARRDTRPGADDGAGTARVIYAPRPALRVVTGLRRGKVEQAALDAIAVCGLVGRALAHEHGHAPRAAVSVGVRGYGDGAGALELRITALVEHLAGVLSDASIGRAVLDGTADVRLLNTLVPTPAEVVRLSVRDAAPVERVFVPWSHGSRRHCLLDGAPVWSELLAPMREGLALAAEGLAPGSTLAVFSWQAVTLALDADELRPTLDELRARGITVVTGYYGNTRGRNDWRHVDALLAVGTPWPPSADVAMVCAAAGLVGVERDVGVHITRAELEQVVARFRAARRDKGGRLVVVASQPPLRADARWKVRTLAVGRPAVAVGADLAALAAAHGRNEAARLAGVSTRTVSRAVAATTPGGGVGRNPLLSTPATHCAPPPPHPPGGLSTPGEAVSRREHTPAPYNPPPVSDVTPAASRARRGVAKLPKPPAGGATPFPAVPPAQLVDRSLDPDALGVLDVLPADARAPWCCAASG